MSVRDYVELTCDGCKTAVQIAGKNSANETTMKRETKTQRADRYLRAADWYQHGVMGNAGAPEIIQPACAQGELWRPSFGERQLRIIWDIAASLALSEVCAMGFEVE